VNDRSPEAAGSIEAIRASGYFENIDIHLGRFIAETFASHDFSREIFLAAALASKLSRSGHSCIPLERQKLQKILLCEEDEIPGFIDLATVASWKHILLERSAAMSGEEALNEPCTAEAIRPLVVDISRDLLYIYRYWRYEQHVLKSIQFLQGEECSVSFNRTLFRNAITALFPNDPLRQAAAATAASRRFAVITGGPGTGKTTTVARVLALLLMLHPAVSIAVAAPTGKAAARIAEAIKGAKNGMLAENVLEGLSPTLPAASILEGIPSEASTIHRLLGSKRDSPYFRRTRENPLPFDIVVVDEASMVDLPLMAKLMDALKEGSRLILLGDKNQLASVEIGVVFSDICSEANVNNFSPASAARLKDLAGVKAPAATKSSGWIEGSIVELTKNYRFRSDSGIGLLSAAINDGAADEVIAILSGASGDAELSWNQRPPSSPEQMKEALNVRIEGWYGGLFAAKGPEEAFRCIERFRILSPLRKGPFGVASVNAIVEAILREKKLTPKAPRYYAGKPLIVTENDYGLHLYNGDVGVVMREDSGELRVFFPGAASGEDLRSFMPGRLPSHEVVYAMTVHKSQGSEFDRVLLILPPEASPLLTRELLYTAITRARKKVEIWGSEEVIRKCIEQRVERVSGMVGHQC
jgi:exodeoxyribonuclease V alpha subunit